MCAFSASGLHKTLTQTPAYCAGMCLYPRFELLPDRRRNEPLNGNKAKNNKLEKKKDTAKQSDVIILHNTACISPRGNYKRVCKKLTLSCQEIFRRVPLFIITLPNPVQWSRSRCIKAFLIALPQSGQSQIGHFPVVLQDSGRSVCWPDVELTAGVFRFTGLTGSQFDQGLENGVLHQSWSK